MNNSLLLLCCAGLFSFSACNKTEKTESDTATVIKNDEEGALEKDALFRDQAGEASRMMATDLKFENDTEKMDRSREIYYNWVTRRDELQTRYASDPEGMKGELESLTKDTDREFRGMFTDEQYQTYETRKERYYHIFDASGANGNQHASGSGQRNGLSPNAEVTVKRDKDGDTKTIIKDGDKEIKIKRDADDGNVKVKRDD